VARGARAARHARARRAPDGVRCGARTDPAHGCGDAVPAGDAGRRSRCSVRWRRRGRRSITSGWGG
jgi:hypothetical protein